MVVWWLLVVFWATVLLMIAVSWFTHTGSGLDFKVGTAILVGNAVLFSLLLFPPVYLGETVIRTSLTKPRNQTT
jgi:hypothetical protein